MKKYKHSLDGQYLEKQKCYKVEIKPTFCLSKNSPVA